MNNFQRLSPLILLAVFLVVYFIRQTILTAQSNPEFSVVESAQNFLESLGLELHSKVLVPFSDEERYNWHYFPRSRKGVHLGEMADQQKINAFSLLKKSMSEQGYFKAVGIIKLEDILRKYEGRPQNDRFRDPGKYYVTVFGKPDQDFWGWRLEGHHLSLNFSLKNNEIISSTPAFMGANPADAPIDDSSKYGILHLEEFLGRELIRSLSAEQKEKAIFSDRAPFDIMSGTEKTIRQIDSKGIYFSELDKAQKGMLLRLIKLYVSNLENEFAAKLMNKVEREDPNKIMFAWAGGLDPGQGHYYSILASSILIEYDNTQNNSNHIHTVFREIKNDFGEDFLLNHYKRSEHHN